MSTLSIPPPSTDFPPSAVKTELLTVIVPCLNEEANIAATVGDILQTAVELPVNVEVLMVDDGSTDKTLERMQRLCDQDERCRILVNEKNLGVGRSVLNACDHVPASSWVTVMPGDNEIVFSSIKNHLAVRQHFDVVLGYLYNAVIRTAVRRAASSIFTSTANSLYGFSFRYLNGMKLYRVEAFRGLEVVGRGHAFNGELIAKALLRNPNLRIGEAPFIARGRAFGETKAFRPSGVLHAVRDTWRGYRAVNDFRDRIIAQRNAEEEAARLACLAEAAPSEEQRPGRE